jgi:hypothetical protein
VTFTACLLAVTACGEAKKPPPPAAPVDGIELVKPGAEPRVQLAYRFAKEETPLVIESDIDLEQVDAKAVIPTLTMALTHAITEVGATGAKVKLTVTKGGARSRNVDHDVKGATKVMDRQSALLGGLVIGYNLSPNGVVTNSKVEAVGRDLSEPMQEQTAQLLGMCEQIAMVLPDKPVGVGAIWKYRRTIKQNQLTLVSTTNVEVTAIDGDRITFKATLDLTGLDQTITQNGQTAEVRTIGGTGTHEGTFDLAKAIVIGEQRAQLGFQMIAEGKPRPTKIQMVVRIKPPAPEQPAPPADGSANGSNGSANGSAH